MSVVCGATLRQSRGAGASVLRPATTGTQGAEMAKRHEEADFDVFVGINGYGTIYKLTKDKETVSVQPWVSSEVALISERLGGVAVSNTSNVKIPERCVGNAGFTDTVALAPPGVDVPAHLSKSFVLSGVVADSPEVALGKFLRLAQIN